MKLAENIFFSIQGEGPTLGRPAIFLRLAGCNLRCKYCDTKYSWEDKEETDIQEIVKEIKNYPCKRIVITGGEPALQEEEIIKLIDYLDSDYIFEIETNGTIQSDLEDVQFNVSPKLSNSGNKFEDREIHISYLWKKSIFKFVIQKESDVEEVLQFVILNEVPREKIWLMAEGITSEDLKEKQKWLVEICKKYGFNLTPRMHIDIFGNKKGV